jgi:hypothetical protein
VSGFFLSRTLDECLRELETTVEVSGFGGYDMMRPKTAWGAGISYAKGPFVGRAGAVGATIFVEIGLRF